MIINLMKLIFWKQNCYFASNGRLIEAVENPYYQCWQVIMKYWVSK